MPNHVHLVARPEREESLGLLLRRVHGRYAQYYNARTGRSGHLWQNRIFSCALGPGHLWAALAYVERNPVLAGLAQRAGDYRWSSAGAHLSGGDPAGVLDLDWWRRENPEDREWRLNGGNRETDAVLRSCTHAGRPFGSEDLWPKWPGSSGAGGFGGVRREWLYPPEADNSTQIRLSPFKMGHGPFLSDW